MKRKYRTSLSPCPCPARKALRTSKDPRTAEGQTGQDEPQLFFFKTLSGCDLVGVSVPNPRFAIPRGQPFVPSLFTTRVDGLFIEGERSEKRGHWAEWQPLASLSQRNALFRPSGRWL